MHQKVSKLFSDADADRIAAAVKQAEAATSGEIVPYVVDRSDDYAAAVWRGGFLCAMLASSAFLLVRLFTETWLPSAVVVIMTTLAAGGAGLLLVSLIPPFKLLFAGSDDVDVCTELRAKEAFLAEEVFKTRDRTGILIFLSLMEKRVIVIGDAGINAKVAESEWQGIVQRIVAGMRNGKPADGLIEAIEQCGALLQAHGVAIRPGDKDELSNTLRTGRKRKS
jgi:putative membrane protein